MKVSKTLMVCAAMAWVAAMSFASTAYAIPFSTTYSSQYLLIGMGSVDNVGQAVNVNNYELGANKAPVPVPSSFGPGLLGNVPNIPLNAKPIFGGVYGDGNIAITHRRGVFNLQNVGLYGDLGIHTAQSASSANVGSSNSFYNDPNFYPNTFTSTGFTNPGVNHNTGGTGSQVNPNQADQSLRIDNNVGVTGNVDFSGMMGELATARSVINSLASTGTLNVSGNGGKISSDFTFMLSDGLNVVDLVTGGNDFLLEKANFVIDGSADAYAIFRIPHDTLFKIANGNLLIGNSGIHLGSVLFYTDDPGNDTLFDFSNTVLNGVAFWALGGGGNEISIDNAQGSTQLIADKIVLNNVRFHSAAFTPIPEPTTVVLVGMATLATLRVTRRRRPVEMD